MARNELKAILDFLNSSAQKRGRFELTPDGVVYCQSMMTIDIPEDQVRLFYTALLNREKLARQWAAENALILDWTRKYLGDPIEEKYLDAIKVGRKIDGVDAPMEEGKKSDVSG